MLRLISRLANLTIFSFLCALIYINLAIADPDSTAMESLKGTGSTGSFSYEEDHRLAMVLKVENQLRIRVRHLMLGSEGR